jgi:hypothetical protein
MALIGNNKVDYKPNDVVLTQAGIFEALGLTFDLDPAHPPFETNVPCKRYYTETDDGLTQSWEGLVWLNPPYSKPAPWVDRFIQHENGIALLPIAKSNWSSLIWTKAHAVLFPDKASTYTATKAFEQNGKPHSIFMPVAFYAMGETATQALHNSGLGRVR